MIKTPEQWKNLYSEGMYTLRELFSKLIECSKEYPIARIIAVLEETEWQEFGEYVMRCASAEREDDIVWVNGTPTWVLADVRKFVPYVVKGRRGTHTAE